MDETGLFQEVYLTMANEEDWKNFIDSSNNVYELPSKADGGFTAIFTEDTMKIYD